MVPQNLGHFQVGSYRYRSLIEGLYTLQKPIYPKLPTCRIPLPTPSFNYEGPPIVPTALGLRTLEPQTQKGLGFNRV